MKLVFSFILSALCTAALFAQAGPLSVADNVKLQKAESDLLQISYTMHTDSSDDTRFLACKLLIKDLVEALKTPNSFNFDFSGLEGIKVIMAPDSSFRFFTWELHVNREEYRHYGAIQYNTGELKLLPLIDRGAQLRQNPETAVTSNTDWLGYVIYNILRGGTYQGKPYYFLFGYDRHAALSRQKVLDVFYFDDEGKPVFGLPVFAVYTPEGHLLEDHTRLVLTYSAEANIAMRFEPETNRIVYENLIIAQGPDGGPISLPDGSYHALEYGTDGRWHEVSKVFDHKYEKAPVERVRPTEAKDIVGRPKGND